MSSVGVAVCSRISISLSNPDGRHGLPFQSLEGGPRQQDAPPHSEGYCQD